MSACRKHWFGIAVFAAVIWAQTASFGDQPPASTRAIFSPSGDRFVRIVPGQGWGEAAGFGGTTKGTYAKAEFYERRDDASYVRSAVMTLLNPVAPVQFFVSDKGNLATIDNWQNVGYGKVFALYGPDGSLLRSYELRDLFSDEEIAHLDHSGTSIMWHKESVYLQTNQKGVYVNVNSKDSAFVFDAETGAYRFCEWHAKEFVCRTSNNNKSWQPY